MKVDVLSTFLGGSCLPSSADCRLRIVGVFRDNHFSHSPRLQYQSTYVRNVVYAGLLKIARAMILGIHIPYLHNVVDLGV